MSERDDVLLLVDISDSINKILLYTSSFTFEDYTTRKQKMLWSEILKLSERRFQGSQQILKTIILR